MSFFDILPTPNVMADCDQVQYSAGKIKKQLSLSEIREKKRKMAKTIPLGMLYGQVGGKSAEFYLLRS